jgi:carboxyl-terminal processing protease
MIIKHVKTLFFLLTLTLATSFAHAVAPPDQKEIQQYRPVAIYLSKFLQDHHFARHPIDKLTTNEWIKNYMTNLDYNRLLFVNDDYDHFVTKYSSSLANQLQNGNIDAAFDIQSTFFSRLTKRMAWINTRLDKPFDFSEKDYYKVDRSKVVWPKDETESNKLWEERLKYDMLLELLSDKKDEKKDPKAKDSKIDEKKTVTPDVKALVNSEAAQKEAADKVKKRYQRMEKIFNEMDVEETVQTYFNALTSVYDPHSQYLSPSTLEDFSIGINLSLVGIGAVLSSEDGYCVVKEIIAGGPASLDKRLRVNDKIVGVGQGKQGEFTDIVDMKLRNAVRLIRGKKETTVRLKVIPSNSSDPASREVIDIVRNEIKLSDQQAHAEIIEQKSPKGESYKIGVLILPSFYGASESDGNSRSCSDDVKILLQRLMQEKVDGVILDLRSNGGGLLDEAIKLTGLFIDEGPVVQVKDHRGNLVVYRDEDKGEVYRGPLVVLTNRQSASASEILAGALQNYERAIIIGNNQTHGKGTVQMVVELDKLMPTFKGQRMRAGGIKLTVQKFYLPNGHSTQNRGVLADVSLPSLLDELKIGESELPHALPWDEISGVSIQESEYVPYRNILRALQRKSEDRTKSEV